MNSQEFKRVLSLAIVELENLSKQDLTKLGVNPQWSAIDDVAQHVHFLRSQLDGLSKHIFDKQN